MICSFWSVHVFRAVKLKSSVAYLEGSGGGGAEGDMTTAVRGCVRTAVAEVVEEV